MSTSMNQSRVETHLTIPVVHETVPDQSILMQGPYLEHETEELHKEEYKGDVMNVTRDT